MNAEESNGGGRGAPWAGQMCLKMIFVWGL